MAASVSTNSSVPKLFIGYAHKSVTKEQVKEAFENALNEEGIVSAVDFREKTNERGEPFWCYFIHFASDNRQLQHMRAEIAKNGFVVMTYAREWDKKKWNDTTRKYGAYVDRYWKVLAYNEKPKTVAAAVKFMPRLLTLAEAEAAGITAPKKKEVVKSCAEVKSTHCPAPAKAWQKEECGGKAAVSKLLPLTTDELYTPNLDWDSHSSPPAELPEIPPTPPVFRRSPSTAEEYGMPSRPKRRRSLDDVENAFSALGLNASDEESEEEKLSAKEAALSGLA